MSSPTTLNEVAALILRHLTKQKRDELRRLPRHAFRVNVIITAYIVEHFHLRDGSEETQALIRDCKAIGPTHAVDTITDLVWAALQRRSSDSCTNPGTSFPA